MRNILNVDTREIMKEIAWISSSTNIEPKYCIMSQETLDILKNTYDCDSYIVISNKLELSRETICGLDIAICKNLKLGEVEVK